MRIAVTGATGFLGSNVVRKLLAAPAAELLLSVRPESDLWRIEDLLPQLNVEYVDLEDHSKLERAFARFNPECVIHLAWHGVLGEARNDLSQHRNVSISTCLINLAAKTGATSWIGVGSQAEYGPWSSPIDENTPTHPTTVYGAAKLATCILAERMCKAAGLRFVWLRLFSSYGPKDHVEWMIPYLTNTLLRRGRPSLTSGEQLWDYLFVEDAADAFVSVVRNEKAEGIFNLASGETHKLRYIVELIRDMVDPTLELGFGEVPYRTDQVMRLEANISGLRTVTGWRPVTPLHEGLRRTVSWYRDAHQK